MSLLRIVMMVVLTVGVIGAAGWLALSAPGPEPDPGETEIERLVRRLGGADPDRAREAAAELVLLLPRSRPALEEAARSKDPLLAGRAGRILALHPAAPVP